MRLTDAERELLFALQFNADDTVAALRKKTRLREHSIHYYLGKFRLHGVLRRGVIVDFERLGLSQYEVYFSLDDYSPRTRDRLFKLLHSLNSVIWFAELGGNYQFAFTVLARSVYDVISMTELVSERIGRAITRKSVAVLASFTLFQKKYLSAKKASAQFVTIGKATSDVRIDSLDGKILAAYFRPDFASFSELSRRLNVPRSTLDLRARRLESNAVIKAHIYAVNARAFGMSSYRLLLFMRTSKASITEQLFQFCHAHPHVVILIRGFGSWDFEIAADVETAAEAHTLVQQVYEQFGESIGSIELLPVFHQGRSHGFLSDETLLLPPGE